MKKEYSFVKNDKLLEKIHLIIVYLHIISVLLMIFSYTLRFYAAIFVGIIGLAQFPFKGYCPLTIEENKIRKKAGREEKKGVIHHYFKENFNINLPNLVINILTWMTFALAYFIILNYFFKWV